MAFRCEEFRSKSILVEVNRVCINVYTLFILEFNKYDSWDSLHDRWNASLWDIYPKIQICGIGENDTVLLDGARAADIRWKS